MHILVLASGSGGHVYPALSFIKEALKKHQITYLMLENGFECQFEKQLKVNIIKVKLPNQFKKYYRHPHNFLLIKKELKKHEEILKNIDIIISFGGFVSILGIYLKLKYKAKLFLHEQNYKLGDGNKVARLFAQKIFLSFANSAYKHKRYEVVGNPRMDEAHVENNYSPLNNFNVLFFAGSLSSSSLNKIIYSLLEKKFPLKIKFHIITGKAAYSKFKSLESSQVHVYSYQDNMLQFMNKMSLIVMRAGATSLSEIIALNKVAITIPSPNVKHNHQKENANFLQQKEAIIMLEEKDLNADILSKQIYKLYDDKILWQKIKINIRQFDYYDVRKKMLSRIENEKI